jgi:hypothetical protein
MKKQIRVTQESGWDSDARWRDWFLIPVVAVAYKEAEPLVRRRATDTVVLRALEINGEFSTVRIGVVVDKQKDVVDIVILNDERDGDARKLTFTPHYDGDDWEPQASNPRWDTNPDRI